jgi:hypothetical protein
LNVLIVLVIILILIIALLNIPISLNVSCIDEKLEYKVTFCGFKIYPRSNKKNKPQKEKKSKNKVMESEKISSDSSDTDKSENTANLDSVDSNDTQKHSEGTKEKKSKKKEKKEKPEKSLSEKLEYIKNILEISKNGIKHVFHGIYFSDVFLDLTAADEDAYKAAIKYGVFNAAVYKLLALLSCFFKLKYEKVNIKCAFNSADSIYNFRFKLNFRPIALIYAAFSIILHYLINTKFKFLKKELKPA